MSAGGEIAIKIVGHADTRDIEAVRKAVGALGPEFAKTARDIGVEGEKAERSLRDVGASADGMGSALASAGKVAAIGLAAFTVAAAGAVAVGMSLVSSAEALGDAQARVGAVFGAEAAAVIDDNASIANSLGLTKTAYLDSVGAMGQFATNLGVNKDAAADMAMGLTELAPKLAAYTGAEKEAVNDALEKALAGKTKGLADLGIAVGDIPKGLSDAAAAELIYQRVMDQTANAQAEWVNNQGDVDNSMASLKATFEDVKAKAGGLIAEAVGPWLQTAAGYAAELSAAFDVGGIDAVAAKLDELTGYDVSGWLATAREKWDELTVAAKDFYDNQLVPFAEFLTGTVGPAVSDLTSFLLKHKDMVLIVIGVYAAFKTAMAINKAVEAAGAALAAMKGAWAAYKAGTLGATLATTSFGTALKLAMGPVGWIIIAVGLLAAAWSTNFLGMRDKAEALWNWIKMLPQYFAGVFDEVKAKVLGLFIEWAVIWKKLKDDPVKGFGELVVFLGTLPAKLLSIGVDIIEGLLKGIKRAWDGLKRWLSGAAGAVPQVVKSSLKMMSPPPEMIVIGWWIVEAMRLGMVKAEGGLIDTASNIARDAVAAFWAFENGGGIEAGRAAVAALIAQVQGLRSAFLTGGTAEEGSLAWLLSTAADGLPALDFGALFASMNIPVADIDAFGRLLAQLVDAGELDRAQDLWSRFYDEIGAREDAIHEQRMANIEAQRKAALDKHDVDRKAMLDIIDTEKRHFEYLKDQQAQEAAKPGGTPAGPKLKHFSDEVERVQEKLRGVIDLIDGDAGNGSLADFWKMWNDDVNANITTTEDLGKAIDAILERAGEAWDKLQKGIEDGWDATAKTEEQRHNHAVELLKARASLIDTLLADQALAEEALNALYAERERLLRLAQESIKAAQKAAEEFEDSVHAGVMANIAELRRQTNFDHKTRMIHLGDEKKAIDAGHVARLGQLQTQRDRVTKGFDERRTQIEKERTALGQLKLDLGVEDALIRLTGLQDKLNDLKGIMDSFKVVSRGREALDEQRRAVIDRVKITTDAQRKALQDVLDSGTLSAKDARRVELLLLGRGTQRATDVQRILGASADVLQGQIDAAQMIVDRNTLMVTAAERRIELAETQLSLDEQNAGVILQAIDDRIAKEADRYAREMGAIDAKITAEEDAFNQTMEWIDKLDQAEDDRHAKRMSDIAAEYALELAKLGMSQEQIDAMVAGAQREAARIAAETEAAFKHLREAAGLPGTVGSTGPAPLPPSIPHVSIGTLPGMLGPMPPGNPIIGLRPGGTPGGLEVNITQPAVTINPVPVTYNDTFVTNTTLVVGGKTLTEFNQQLDAQRQRDMAIGGGP